MFQGGLRHERSYRPVRSPQAAWHGGLRPGPAEAMPDGINQTAKGSVTRMSDNDPRKKENELDPNAQLEKCHFRSPAVLASCGIFDGRMTVERIFETSAVIFNFDTLKADRRYRLPPELGCLG